MPALEAFLAVSGQWRVAPGGAVMGLDYTAVRAGLDMAGIAVTPALWADLREIEKGALAALNERG